MMNIVTISRDAKFDQKRLTKKIDYFFFPFFAGFFASSALRFGGAEEEMVKKLSNRPCCF